MSGSNISYAICVRMFLSRENSRQQRDGRYSARPPKRPHSRLRIRARYNPACYAKCYLLSFVSPPPPFPAARSLGWTHRPRLPGGRCLRATSCQRPPCVSRAAHHRAKRRAEVWCSLPMLGPCAQRQRYATACCAYRPTFIRCLSINPPPPPPPPPPP